MNHADFETKFVEWGTPAYDRAYAKYKRQTGKTIKVVPTFWVEETNQSTTYTQLGAVGLAIEAEGVIGWAVKTIGSFLFGRIKARRDKRKADEAPENLGGDQPLGAPAEDGSPNPFRRTPVDEPEEDWGGVRVVVYADIDGIRGKLIGAAGNLSEKPFGRLLRKISKGKAELIIARNVRGEAVAEASGTDPKPIALLILIPKTNQGFLKGIAIRKFETKIRDKFPDGIFIIDAIMERTDEADYNAVIVALRTPETVAVAESGAAESMSTPEKIFDYWKIYERGGIGSILLAIGGLAWRTRRKKNVETAKT